MSRIVDVDLCPDRDMRCVDRPTPSASERVLSPMCRVRAYVLCTKCVVVSVLSTVWAMALAGLYTEFVQCRGPHAPPPCRRPSRAACPAACPAAAAVPATADSHICTHTLTHTAHTSTSRKISTHGHARSHITQSAPRHCYARLRAMPTVPYLQYQVLGPWPIEQPLQRPLADLLPSYFTLLVK